MSERVALRLVLPGVVVTWIVTGFPVPRKSTPRMRCRLSLPSLRPDKFTLAGLSAKAGNVRARFPAIVPAAAEPGHWAREAGPGIDLAF
jgi:hypothetical protein